MPREGTGTPPQGPWRARDWRQQSQKSAHERLRHNETAEEDESARDNDDTRSAATTAGMNEMTLGLKSHTNRMFLLGMISFSCLTHSLPGDKAALTREPSRWPVLLGAQPKRSQDIYWRFVIFCRSGWVSSETLDEFIALYKSTRKNGGNTSVHTLPRGITRRP